MIDWTATPHKTYWYVFDAHQSVLGLVDNSGQFVVNYTYNAFGEITGSTGTVTTGDGRLLRDANPFRYASYQYDNESGFYYLKSRYYIPFMGRSLTRDVVPSNNLYVYCGNNPVNYVDSNGNIAAEVVGTIIGAILGALFEIIGQSLAYFINNNHSLSGLKIKWGSDGLSAFKYYNIKGIRKSVAKSTGGFY